jgi:PAS domain S-box-containing protein
MLPVYVVLLSKDYHVPFANRFFRERFGESGGKRCYEYLFNRDKPCQNCESFKTLKNNSPHHWEWFGPDGRYYDIFDFPFTDTDGSVMVLEMGIDITSQKQAQESLLQASQYSRSLIETSLDPLVTISSEGKITDVNEATIKATGLARPELVGTDFSNYFTEPQKAREGYQQVFAKGFVTDYPLTMRHKDGSLIDVLYNASVYRDAQGNVLGVFAAARDVTVLKGAEKELLLYKDHLEALVDERTQELAEAQAELEKKVFERTSQLLKSNEQLNIEILERQKIEREIRARNSLLRLAARSASRKDYLDSVVKLLSGWSGAKCVGVRLLNEDGKIPYESYVGFSKRFWERESQLSLKKDKCACIRVVSGEFHPLDAGVVTAGGSFCCGNTAEFIDGLSENERTQFRGECIREGFKSLTIIPMRFKGKIIGAIHFADKRLNLPDPETIGRLESLVMRVAEDTIKFNLFDEILKSNEILERVFSTTNFHIAYMDVNFNFIRVNHAYAVMFNQQPEFFAGKNHFGLYPDDENEEIFRQVVKSAEAYTSFDKPFTYNNGQLGQPVRYYDWSLQPLKDPLGKVEGLILFLVDTTKRKHAEEELIKAQMQLADAKRLSDIGTLAATVAHELRNPLAAIQMASYNIRRKAQNPLLDKHLLTVENKVNESEQIISNLLFYSRLKSPQYEDVDIYGLINECVKLARQRFLKERVSFSADLAAIKNIPFEADPLQMKEVFSNILNNAYESQRKDGRRVELKARVNNGYINLIIQDSGEGIGKDDLEKVFDPFFTTKAKGTGLGLTVCKQVVNMHGGGIGIESEKGKGTTVTVVLPVKKVS